MMIALLLLWGFSMNREKTFTIECTMSERWIPTFMSFLQKLQYNGVVGHTGIVAIMSDGDGDFRPKFTTDEKYYITNPSITSAAKEPPEFLYDAG